MNRGHAHVRRSAARPLSDRRRTLREKFAADSEASSQPQSEANSTAVEQDVPKDAEQDPEPATVASLALPTEIPAEEAAPVEVTESTSTVGITRAESFYTEATWPALAEPGPMETIQTDTDPDTLSQSLLSKSIVNQNVQDSVELNHASNHDDINQKSAEPLDLTSATHSAPDSDHIDIAPPETVALPASFLETEVSYRLLSPKKSLSLSAFLHGSVAVGLMAASNVAPPPLQPVANVAESHVTEIRIGKHLYYVNDIAGSQEGLQTKSLELTVPRMARSRPSPSIPSPPNIAAPAAPAASSSSSTASAALAAIAAAVVAPPAAARETAPVFVPPDVHRTPNATQTLIQSISPPDLIPPPVPLPAFRVMATQPRFPRIPRQFVVPGQKSPAPPSQNPEVAAINIEIANQPLLPSDLTPRLAVPKVPLMAPPPTPKANPGPSPATVGDPVAILSLNDRPLPMPDKLIVPAGNIAPTLTETDDKSGTAVSKSSGTGGSATNAANVIAGGTSNGTKTEGNKSEGLKSGNQSGSGTVAALLPPGLNAGRGTSAAAGNGGATGSANTANGGSGNSGSPNGPNGSNGGSSEGGVGASNPNGSAEGNPAQHGLTKDGLAEGNGGTAGRTAPGKMMTRPANGNFDAVVVQSSPLDQFPESRGLLSGRPIYSVYIPAGSARDWTLYFCVPGEKPTPASPKTSVVNLGAPITGIKAPYPLKLIRPDVKLPSYEKYVLVHGMVNESGRFERMQIVGSIQADIDRDILAALAQWEFRPANKAGAAIPVEVLLSIPAKGL